MKKIEVIQNFRFIFDSQNEKKKFFDHLENALLNCRFYLRSIPSYQLEKQLPQIGSRSEKHHFLLTEKNDRKVLMTIAKQGKENSLPLHTETCRFAFSNVLTVLNVKFFLSD